MGKAAQHKEKKDQKRSIKDKYANPFLHWTQACLSHRASYATIRQEEIQEQKFDRQGQEERQSVHHSNSSCCETAGCTERLSEAVHT